MIYEIAQITIRDGHELAFEKAVAQACQFFKTAKGCRSFKLQRGIENSLEYQLYIGWDTLEDHTVTFRGSEGFQMWRQLASPHFSQPPKVRHVTNVLDSFD